MEQRNSKSSSTSSGSKKPATPPPGSARAPQSDPDSGDLDLSELDLGSVDLGALDLDDEVRLQPLDAPTTAPLVDSRAVTRVVAQKVKGKAVANEPTGKNASSPKLGLNPTGASMGSLTGEPAANVQDPLEAPVSRSRWRWFSGAAPSWLVSLVVHVAIIFTLAAITLDPIDKVPAKPACSPEAPIPIAGPTQQLGMACTTRSTSATAIRVSVSIGKWGPCCSSDPTGTTKTTGTAAAASGPVK